MRLNKIEIKGFKSFGDKTIINFNKGVTGIVGPNGCGKSNIVDAIRWVLGEQKTSLLRSDKMENVIFNGSKSRKKLQLAEVSISFDNIVKYSKAFGSPEFSLTCSPKLSYSSAHVCCGRVRICNSIVFPSSCFKCKCTLL